MVASSPLKRSALGSISSILNTTPKTPTKQGRVGKSATPRSTGIRQRLVHMFTGNKENSLGKSELEGFHDGEKREVHSRGKHIQHLLSTDRTSIQMEDVTVEQQLPVASTIVDVSAHAVDQPASSGPSPEIRQIAALLSNRLRLAAYKVSSQQIHTPLSDLAVLPADTGDKSVSLAIQRFRESKQIQDKAEYFRKHRLSTICRRESRRTRHEKKSKRKQPPTFPSTMAKRTRLIRQPSTITEVPSDQEERGLPSPPDSQPSKTPSTPAPKTKIRAAKRKATYDEYNGHLGLSSPPQQAYDPQENGRDWYMDDVEVGDVPSSVLRGVQGLWALGS